MPGTTRTIGEQLASLVARAKERADRAERDPEFREQLHKLATDAIAEEAASRRRRRERVWAEMGVPERLWPMFHASETGEEGAPRDTAALQLVGCFLSPAVKETFLILAGGVGTGKTVAASWGCAFHGGRLVKSLDLVRAGLYPDDASFWPGLQRVRLLAIDDLGAEPLDAKGYGNVAISDLVDRRYDGARKTIITTNLTKPQFRERYGSGAWVRLWERFTEVGAWQDLAGGSMRRAG